MDGGFGFSETTVNTAMLFSSPFGGLSLWGIIWIGFVVWLFWTANGYLKWKVEGRSKREKAEANPIDEARLIQELHATATRLEERVEALETILLERAGSPKEML
jgi:phage shock protein B